MIAYVRAGLPYVARTFVAAASLLILLWIGWGAHSNATTLSTEDSAGPVGFALIASGALEQPPTEPNAPPTTEPTVEPTSAPDPTATPAPQPAPPVDTSAPIGPHNERPATAEPPPPAPAPQAPPTPCGFGTPCPGE